MTSVALGADGRMFSAEGATTASTTAVGSSSTAYAVGTNNSNRDIASELALNSRVSWDGAPSACLLELTGTGLAGLRLGETTSRGRELVIFLEK